MSASIYDELGSLTYLSGFFAFFIMPYAAMSFTERSVRRTELIDRVYDIVAIGCVLLVIGVAIVQSGVEGLIAVGVGVGLVTGIFGILVVAVVIMVGVVKLVSVTAQ
jgi:hypothetical protein